MISISIAFDVPAMTIPIGYHHQVQSLIYSLLRYGGGEDLHDEELEFESRPYRLFTFSSLRGGKIQQKALHFERAAFLDVRSIRPEFCEALLAGLNTAGALRLFDRPLTVRSVKTSGAVIIESRLRVKMLSPLTVHKTGETGRTEYLNPLDEDFAAEMNGNFARKYHAFTGQTPAAGISVRASAVGAKDRYITLYKRAAEPGEKDIYITGWRGEYELGGRPEHLTFLYYSGLGARNSDGFGMFEPI